jgi:cyclomaltodextrinase / maltogenic alpha-amylase / neopullulanase
MPPLSTERSFEVEMTHWAHDALFYHIYPLGLCGAPHQNRPSEPLRQRLDTLLCWLDHARTLGANTLLLGPVLESGSHGYDVMDYDRIDRRLGDGPAMVRVADEAHARGLRLVMDGVFHHVGRDFWAFRDLLERGRTSRYRDWFHIDFNGRSPFNDPFSYQGWNACYDLVKLNLRNPDVRSHLFTAVAAWIRDYRLDGLRLDAADHLDLGFMQDLGAWCRRLKPDFWLMGEAVKGPYNRLLEEGGLDSVTNYECYKGLYSSFNDGNFFEIAHTLRQHFGDEGRYRSAPLYSFVDNHDVARIAGILNDPAHLYPLYCLLVTIPGTPAIYYGSEFGITGSKSPQDDWSLRPALNLKELREEPRHHDLVRALSRLAHLRAKLPALRRGNFSQLFLNHHRLIFSRRIPDQWIIVAVSAEKEPATQEITLPVPVNGRLVDLLNAGEEFAINDGRSTIAPLWPCWARVMEVQPES